eukprot:scaffold4637_cov128-Cylindrotheca_fusiformis.AAC.6
MGNARTMDIQWGTLKVKTRCRLMCSIGVMRKLYPSILRFQGFFAAQGQSVDWRLTASDKSV